MIKNPQSILPILVGKAGKTENRKRLSQLKEKEKAHIHEFHMALHQCDTNERKPQSWHIKIKGFSIQTYHNAIIIIKSKILKIKYTSK